MRKLALMTLAAGVLAAAPISASAATIVEDFNFFFSQDSSTNANYFSEVAGFDPSLGTLTGATIFLGGSLTWAPAPSGHVQPSLQTLQMVLASPIAASQTFMAFNGADDELDVDMNGAGSAASIGSGPQQVLLVVNDTSDGVFVPDGKGGRLDGVVTYTFTPATPAVPEASTWAMMLIGFAGLGYAAARRKGVLGTISA
jgi:hypothetical protein